VSDVGTAFPGSTGDIFRGGITGPRYFMDPKERLIGILVVQAPSQQAAYHAELRAMVYGALVGKGGR
jgi:CubicO group peptidase (beta-lactamase class C family)